MSLRLPRNVPSHAEPEPLSSVPPLATGKQTGSLTREIWTSRVTYRSPSHPHLIATIWWHAQSLQLSAFLNSGAEESFIDRRVVDKLGIETQALDAPLGVRALNSACLALVERRTIPLDLRLSGNFHIIDSPHTPLVLGYRWLHKHNPHIDWPTFTTWSTYCHLHCLQSDSASTPSPPEPPDLSSLCEVYHDFLVFSKHYGLSLPPHLSVFFNQVHYAPGPSAEQQFK